MVRSVNVEDWEGPANAAKIREKGPAAMAAFDLSAERSETLTTGLKTYRQGLRPEEFSQLAAACIQVLAAWAEAEASSLPGQSVPDVRCGTPSACSTPPTRSPRRPSSPLRRALLVRRASYLVRLGDKERASVSTGQAAQQKPGTALDCFLAAQNAYRRQDYTVADTECEKALRLEPENFWAEYLDALCLVKQRQPRWAEAKRALNHCLGRQPDFLWGRMLRGMSHGQLGETTAAEADFASVLGQTADPLLRWSALMTRGAMWGRMRRWDEAVADLRLAVRERPDLPEGYVSLALALKDRRELDAALAALDQAIGRWSTDPELFRTPQLT